MKKLFSFALIVIILLLYGCGNYVTIIYEATTQSKTEKQLERLDYLFPPEEIKINKSLWLMGLEFCNTSKRYVYYDLICPSSFLPPDTWDNYYDNLYRRGPEPTEMVCLTFIKKIQHTQRSI